MGLRGIKHDYNDYNVLEKNVGQFDVILSDLESSWMIPTFGGKIIASKHPAHWIGDHHIRRVDVNRFLSADVQISEKNSIINKYQVGYIFINKNKQTDFQSYHRFGDIISDSQDFILIKIKKNN